MESKVIYQETNADLAVIRYNKHDILISDSDNTINIDVAKLPDLIAALQSFLPKETE